MNVAEQNLAADMYEAIQHASRYSERSLQASQFQAGISDLGYCSERTRRMLTQEVPEDTDLLPAWIGTWLGTGMEEAVAKMWPDSVIQAEVEVTLNGDGGTYHVKGHPDLIRPGLVVDFKTDRGLNVVRRNGPSQQQQFQRHCYAKGAHESGYFADIPLDQWQVANVWLDRAADERQLHVQMEPYSEEVVQQATWWLDEVVYAFLHNQEARKEPPREVCAKTCGFFPTCRALDTDVSGLLTDDAVLAAVSMHQEGLVLRRQAEQLLDQAKAHLVGVNGSTGEYAVRWVHVNGGHVEYDRSSYQKLDVRSVK